MKHSLIYEIDMVQVCVFGAFALVCIIGAIANAAWWHIGTAAICAALARASLADAKKEEEQRAATVRKEDHDPYPHGDLDL